MRFESLQGLRSLFLRVYFIKTRSIKQILDDFIELAWSGLHSLYL